MSLYECSSKHLHEAIIGRCGHHHHHLRTRRRHRSSKEGWPVRARPQGRRTFWPNGSGSPILLQENTDFKSFGNFFLAFRRIKKVFWPFSGLGGVTWLEMAILVNAFGQIFFDFSLPNKNFIDILRNLGFFSEWRVTSGYLGSLHTDVVFPVPMLLAFLLYMKYSFWLLCKFLWTMHRKHDLAIRKTLNYGKV